MSENYTFAFIIFYPYKKILQNYLPTELVQIIDEFFIEQNSGDIRRAIISLRGNYMYYDRPITYLFRLCNHIKRNTNIVSRCHLIFRMCRYIMYNSDVIYWIKMHYNRFPDRIRTMLGFIIPIIRQEIIIQGRHRNMSLYNYNIEEFRHRICMLKYYCEIIKYNNIFD